MGTGALASVGLVGTASGHEVDGPPVFCGCSQICVCLEGSADVLMAIEDDDGGYEVGFLVGGGELDPYPEGEPRYHGNFCVSIDDEGVPDGKIIGLQVGGTRWVNPNRCADKALAAERRQLASMHPRPEGRAGGPCGKPPCEHPGRNGGGNGSEDSERDEGGASSSDEGRGGGKGGADGDGRAAGEENGGGNGNGNAGGKGKGRGNGNGNGR